MKTVAWLIGAVVILGVLANLAQHDSRSASPHAHQVPAVRVGASDYVLRVTNEGSENWNEMEIYLNDQPPFTYKWVGQAPAVGESVTIPLREFTKKNGERFDIYRLKVTQVWIGGDGYDFRGLRF